ncbi:unnamed protein product [Staurois parvus]|uniref:Uncharacterized protein n=1 Tax=Staurois parvus TaxID=386267 RepID=A0ABN9DCB8_9NEOB|nr:unnamed protein product [Staurois parvus]
MGPLCPCPNSKKPIKKLVTCMFRGSSAPNVLAHASYKHGGIAIPLRSRGGLTIMGPPGNRGSWGPYALAPNSKKPMKKVPGVSHGAPY